MLITLNSGYLNLFIKKNAMLSLPFLATLLK